MFCLDQLLSSGTAMWSVFTLWQLPLYGKELLKVWWAELVEMLSHFSCKLMLLSLSFRSFFELMLFFSKEEFVEEPLKDILDSFQVTPLSQSLDFFIHTTHLLRKAQLPYLPLMSHQQVLRYCLMIKITTTWVCYCSLSIETLCWQKKAIMNPHIFKVVVVIGHLTINVFSHSLQECHSQLLRHRNIYLQHVKLIIKAGGPWENPVLQGILKEADLPPKEGRLMTIFYQWYGIHVMNTALSSGSPHSCDQTYYWQHPLRLW